MKIKISRTEWERLSNKTASTIKLSENWWDEKVGETDVGNTETNWKKGWLNGNWKCPKCGKEFKKNWKGKSPHIEIQLHQEKCKGSLDRKIFPQSNIIKNNTTKEEIDISLLPVEILKNLMETGDFSPQDYQALRLEYAHRQNQGIQAASKKTIKKAISMDLDPDEDRASKAPMPCDCGSGEPRQVLKDARGIFVDYVCHSCKRNKMKKYRPEIFTDSNYESEEPIEPS